MKIGNVEISENSKCFIIAEMSANHGNDIKIAKETIRLAKECGADAIKIQTYTPDTITIDCDNEYFRINKDTIWDGKTLYQLYSEAYTPWEWQEELINYANEIGIICFSSPFDKSSVDFLEKLNVPAYKIASFEITDIPLIKYVASKKKPIIISTGIATSEDIDLAVKTCFEEGNKDVILLHCTSSYPTKIEDSNLIMIKDLKEKYNVLTGLSDHSLGNLSPLISVALGAKVIEKHFIIDKKIGGVDSSFSIDVFELKDMVKNIRDAEKAIGKVDYSLNDKKKKNREFSRSLFIVKDVKKGEVLSNENVRSIRPSNGMHTKYLDFVLGEKFNGNYEKGTPLKIDNINFCKIVSKNKIENNIK